MELEFLLNVCVCQLGLEEIQILECKLTLTCNEPGSSGFRSSSATTELTPEKTIWLLVNPEDFYQHAIHHIESTLFAVS